VDSEDGACDVAGGESADGGNEKAKVGEDVTNGARDDEGSSSRTIDVDSIIFTSLVIVTQQDPS
jgi:hypothetical protein